jgi:hypothetical protein
MGTHHNDLVAGPLAVLLADLLLRPAQGPAGIASLGHRACVGGRWDEIR